MNDHISTFLKTIPLFTLFLLGAHADEAHDQINPNRDHPVGREHRTYVDKERMSWVNNSNRPLATTVWYPAELNADEKPWNVEVFKSGFSALGADITPAPKKFPLIVLSHGTGGSFIHFSWLAQILAAKGYIVAAVNHHGNTAGEDQYLRHGFTLWWERATDLSVLIDNLLADDKFGTRIDQSKIGAAGFSLGGYTVLAVAGAIIDLKKGDEFCANDPENPVCVLPPEANVGLAPIDELMVSDLSFKNSMDRSSLSYRDHRIKAVYAMAPVHGPSLTTKSMNAINIPVKLIVGSLDDQAVPEFNAEIIAAAIPNAELEILPNVIHYTFLSTCNAEGKQYVKDLCNDPDGINRDTVHTNTANDALVFFNRALNKLVRQAKYQSSNRHSLERLSSQQLIPNG